jgi:hypothetical protein
MPTTWNSVETKGEHKEADPAAPEGGNSAASRIPHARKQRRDYRPMRIVDAIVERPLPLALDARGYASTFASVSTRVDCDRTVIRVAQNLQKHRGLPTHAV